MARIRQIARPWTQQPQQAVPIADGCADGLELLVNYGVSDMDLLRGRGMTVTGSPALGASPLGRSLVVPSGGYSSGGYAVGPRGGALPLSLLLVSYISAQGALCSVADTYYSGDPFLLLSSDASDLRLFAGGAWRTLGPSATGLQCIGLRYDGAAIEAWRNGAMVWSMALASLGSNNSANLYVGGGYGSAAAAAYAMAAYWHRDVGAAAMGALTSDPWSLFAPRRLWLPASAAGGSLPTLSAATYMPGSLTSVGFRPRVTAS